MILVAGDLMLDVLLLPELQHEEQYSGMLARSGGSAANTAAWMAHLGSPVTFVGCVGADGVGIMLQHELRAEGVVVHVRTVPGMETGCVAVNLDVAGERVMRSARGANVLLGAGDIVRAANGTIRVVHVTGYALLSDAGYAILEAAAQVAHDHGAMLSFDPASVGAVRALDRDRLLRAMVDYEVSVLLPNRVEAVALTGQDDVLEGARQLAASIPKVVVKCGPLGAVYANEGAANAVPTEPVQPVDTTGAGDAFNAGVLVALQRGDEIAEACSFANRIARQAIAVYGGRPSHYLSATQNTK